MKRWLNKLLVCLVLTLMLMVVAGCGDDDDDDDSNNPSVDDDDSSPDDDSAVDDDDDSVGNFYAGFARYDITPDRSLKLAGYGSYFLFESTCRWSEGVHDNIYAQAVAFEDADGDAVILMVLDTGGVIINEVEEIQAAVGAETGIDPHRVIVAATHNHQAPDTIGMWGLLIPPRSGRDEQYIDWMVEQSVAAGIDAWEAREPVHLEWTAGQESAYHFNEVTGDPNRLLDSTMTLLAAYDLKGNLVGSIMNWPSHPTVMQHDNRMISADYPGAYIRFMEQDLGGTHIFVNGAIGASVQPLDPDTGGLYDESDWANLDYMGGGLAETAQELLAEASPIDDPDIDRFAFEPVSVIVQNFLFRLASVFNVIPREVPPVGQYGTTYLATFALGPLRFATMPGEYAPNYSFALRDTLGGRGQVLIGLGLDWIGYAITPEQFTDLTYWYEWLLCPSRWAGEETMAVYQSLWPQK